MKNIILVLSVVMLSIPSEIRAQVGNEHKRDTWYIGFGIGSGDGGTTLQHGEYISLKNNFPGIKTGRVTANFKFGTTVTSKLLAGFDLTAIRAQGKENDVECITQITNYNGMVTYFPKELGFFVRGGMGMAEHYAEIKDQDISRGTMYTGFDVLMGAGYAFWLLKSFNLSLNADYSKQFYGKSEHRSRESNFFNIYLSFDWF